MRTLLLAAALTLLTSACESGPGELKDPPVLTITSPQRSLIQSQAGTLAVTGTALPNAGKTPIASVMVNNVAATVNQDGTFTAAIEIQEGASLIQTVATDKNGGVATDTRSVEAGALQGPGAMIPNALTTALSANAFAKLSAAAGPLIAATDFKPLIAPLQPMVHSGDEDGPDCLYGQLYVSDIKMTGAKISLVPVAGGLMFSAELDGLDVPGEMKYAVACIGGDDSVEAKASSVIVSGTLQVAPNGMNGFTTTLQNPDVQISGLDVSASGVPGAILDILPIDGAIESIAPTAAQLFMGPMMNKALGALAGPKQLMVLGNTIDVQVSASDVSFDTTGGVVVLNTSLLIEAAAGSKGFVFTADGMPTMNPGMGMEIGIADDLANDMMSQAVALGLLNLSIPAQGGTFDATQMAMTSPPMISANGADGKMHLILPDMMATFTLAGTPVAEAAINAEIDLKITPASMGSAVSLQLGAPVVAVNVLPGVANETRFTNDDLAKAAELTLQGQIATLSTLLGAIPLPSVDGLTMTNLSVGGDSGYVMVNGDLQ